MVCEQNMASLNDENIMKPKVVIIGSGGREHAIAKALARDAEIVCIGTHRNPGISRIASDYYFSENFGLRGCVEDYFYCRSCNSVKKDLNIDLVVIGPESVLNENKCLVDDLTSVGIPVFGPNGFCSQIELSKVWCRKFVSENFVEYCQPIYNIIDLKKIPDYFDYLKGNNFVLKQDTVAGGKGVVVSGEHIHNAVDATNFLIGLSKKDDFALYEEKLVGEEFSVMTLTDSRNCAHLPVIQDFKRAKEGNQGPNTGGMGSVSVPHDNSIVTQTDIDNARRINEVIISKLKEKDPSGTGYRGVLYGGFMKTKNGEIKLIEYNARFGDPEVINVLETLDQENGRSLYQILRNCAKGNLGSSLNNFGIIWKPVETVVRYTVPLDYPNSKLKGSEIYLNKLSESELEHLRFASMESKNDRYFLKGSRAIAVVASGETLESATNTVHNIIQKIQGPLYFRSDIPLVKSCNVSSTKPKFTYRSAGVQVEKNNTLVNEIAPFVSGGSKSFGGHFQIPSGLNDSKDHGFNPKGLKLAMTTDGVGSKSDLVLEHFGVSGLAKDLVNHCINDLLCANATPVAFVDYIGTGSLDTKIAKEFIKSVSEACNANDIQLVGGETAEMPDAFQKGKWDFTGTMTGVVNTKPFCEIQVGQSVLAFPSSGPHTNGYTLIRKLVKEFQPSKEIISQLCAPHKNYLEEINALREENAGISGLVHITGGGLVDNPPRVLGSFTIEWNKPLEFNGIWKWIKDCGISDKEMKRTFNCGIGMLAFVETVPEEFSDLVVGHISQ